MMDKPEPIQWTPEMETSLFYAMIDHKPVGENKYFNMIFIYEKYNNLCERKLTSEQIWDHLGTLYDLQALNEAEMVPFDNDECEFTLPDAQFEQFIKKSKETLGKAGKEKASSEASASAGESDTGEEQSPKSSKAASDDKKAAADTSSTTDAKDDEEQVETTPARKKQTPSAAKGATKKAASAKSTPTTTSAKKRRN